MSEVATIPARVDLAFPLAGERVPQDHGYALFGALCRVLGDLHGADWLAVHPIAGLHLSRTELRLDPERSTLRLRVPPDRIGALLSLAGKTLEIDGCRARVGVPTIHTLEPAGSLASRLVSIRLLNVDLKDDKGSEAAFVEALQRQVAELLVSAEVRILRRRVMAVRGKTVVGWGVRLEGLSTEHSLKVQEAGLGGRRRFGCGVFARASRGED